jgi:uncharacterized membrane protein HdeD (DUF308 family)
MSQFAPNPFGSPYLSGLHSLRRRWGWFLLLGLLMVILGIVAITFTVVTTFATVVVFGWYFLLSGCLQLGNAIGSRGWGGVLLHLLGGILGIVLGMLLLVHPLIGAEAITMLLSAYFLVSGWFRIIAALTLRFRNWGWLLLSGILAVVLGILIWRQ